ncbi:MAG: acyl-CoA dehydrogenase family protein [Desulfocucumaceae bacterium]
MLQKGGMFLLEGANPADVFTPEDFSDEHKMIASTCRDFIEKEVIPKIDDIEAQKPGVMRDLLTKAGDLGLLSADIEEEYGGSELGKLSSIIITENISYGGSFALGHGAHTGIGYLPIVLFGNEEQKKKYLPKLATGEWIAAYALTEPGAGSDALAAKTKAVLSDDGKYYILNGEKMFITNAGFADVFVTYAKIDGEKFTSFIVEKGTPGFSTGAEEKKMGIKGSSTCSLIFEDARVPVENVLGEIGKGHVIAFNILNIGRFKLGAGVTGSAKKAIELAVKYALQRQQFKTPIAKFGMIQTKLAQMNARTYASESVQYRLGGLIEGALEDKKTGPEIGKAIEAYAIECSISKVFGSEVLDYVVDEMVQIYGGYGFISEYPAERFYRDSRINRIFEGTNEVNRLIIPATLMRMAMKGELPFLMAAQALQKEIMDLKATIPADDGKPLYTERAMLALVKKLFLMIAGQAAMKYMQKLAEEQELIQIMADIAIEIYAMESCMLRALKAWEQDPASAELKIDLTRAYIYDKWAGYEKLGREAMCYLESGDMLSTQLAIVKRMTRYVPIDMINLRRKICAQIIEKENYVC